MGLKRLAGILIIAIKKVSFISPNLIERDCLA